MWDGMNGFQGARGRSLCSIRPARDLVVWYVSQSMERPFLLLFEFDIYISRLNRFGEVLRVTCSALPPSSSIQRISIYELLEEAAYIRF